eukprot:CAMPEP_0119118326 /NCGR_PEP_ID=MMETSP1310-20130426/220_1 /TAXON_ID=464262 /ORGANISM="Genus nov. species nov., Strain RCC2339" /LENGTH=103 /DNA_ID=CAMNT_0007107673 /DNA_START=73 /DNA_END=384 /DNA_ORIENTATION=+
MGKEGDWSTPIADPKRADKCSKFQIRPLEAEPQANLLTFIAMVVSMIAMAIKSRHLAVFALLVCLVSFVRMKENDSLAQMAPGMMSSLMCVVMIYQQTTFTAS